MYRWAVVATLFVPLFMNVPHVQGPLVNYFDGPFNFTCENFSFIRGILSSHHNHFEDRLFTLTCRKLSLSQCTNPLPMPACSWSGYTNEMDWYQHYRCPGAGYIAGMASYHDNHKEDRRFAFYCCVVARTKVYNCDKTGYVNEFDQEFDFNVQNGKILKGMYSSHNNDREDRRFKFEVCTISCSE